MNTNMQDESDRKKLQDLLRRLRDNKENVALDVLKTKYKINYEKLQQEIKTEALKIIKPIAAKTPKWVLEHIKTESIDEFISIFNRIYEAGKYADRIGVALYRHYSLEEALEIAEEINRQYNAELSDYFKKTEEETP